MVYDGYLQTILVDLRPGIALYIYVLQTPEEYRLDPYNYTGKIFWSDHIATAPQGPRNTVQSAIAMWNVIMAGRRAFESNKLEVVKDNLLDLDAYRNRRLYGFNNPND